MSAEKNIQLVQQLYEAFGKGDVPAILEHIADDVDWGVEAQGSDVPWYGTGKGKPFALRFFETLGREVTFSRFEPHGFTGSDDAVACLVTWEATLKKNGKTTTQNAIHHFTIKNGRISRWRGSEDTGHSRDVWRS